MWKLFLAGLLFGSLPSLACAQQAVVATPAAPSVYPSTPATKSAFIYIPGQIAIASGGRKPSFDMKTAESLKRYCPKVKVMAFPRNADYVMFYSEEWKRDLTVIRNDGEVVFAGSSFWEKRTVVGKACAEILKDWKTHKTSASGPTASH